MNVIYPYCKGALFDNIKVATLVVYATIAYATTKTFVVGSFRYAKNLLKIPCGQKSARITQKSFVKTLT